MVHWSFILGQRWLSQYTKQCRCINCCFVGKAPANVIMQHKQCQLGQNQFCYVLPNLLLCSHPWPNMNKRCIKLKYRLIMLSCTKISFVITFFSILINLESNPGFLLRNSIKLLTQNLEKVILTCFTKIIAEQSCYPICMTNMSYI